MIYASYFSISKQDFAIAFRRKYENHPGRLVLREKAKHFKAGYYSERFEHDHERYRALRNAPWGNREFRDRFWASQTILVQSIEQLANLPKPYISAMQLVRTLDFDVSGSATTTIQDRFEAISRVRAIFTNITELVLHLNIERWTRKEKAEIEHGFKNTPAFSRLESLPQLQRVYLTDGMEDSLVDDDSESEADDGGHELNENTKEGIAQVQVSSLMPDYRSKLHSLLEGKLVAA